MEVGLLLEAVHYELEQVRRDEHLLKHVLHAVAGLFARADIVARAGAPVERRVLLRGRHRARGTLRVLVCWQCSAVGRLRVRVCILDDACLLLRLTGRGLVLFGR